MHGARAINKVAAADFLRATQSANKHTYYTKNHLDFELNSRLLHSFTLAKCVSYICEYINLSKEARLSEEKIRYRKSISSTIELIVKSACIGVWGIGICLLYYIIRALIVFF